MQVRQSALRSLIAPDPTERNQLGLPRSGSRLLGAPDLTLSRVVGAVTLVDRGEVAGAFFADKRIPYFPLVTYRDLGIEPVGGSFTLERFAREGFSAVPGDQLTDLWVWCRDYCEATGDGRYCSIAETLRSVDDWRTEHDELGGVPASLLAEIEAVITTLLPDVIDQANPADGCTARADDARGSPTTPPRPVGMGAARLHLNAEFWEERGAERRDLLDDAVLEPRAQAEVR